jgi:anti-sigma B factor antagonist
MLDSNQCGVATGRGPYRRSMRDGRRGDLVGSFDGPVVRRQGAVVTIEVSGELDLCVAPALRRASDLAFDMPGVQALVVDLRRAEFADTTTLAWLLGCRRERVSLMILATQGPVLSLLEVTGLSDFLDVVAC